MSDSSSPSCAFSLKYEPYFGVLHSECCGNYVNEKRFALPHKPICQLSKVHSRKSAFITCFVQAHCILHVQLVSESVRRLAPVLSPENHRCGSRRWSKQPSYHDCSISMELVRTFALYVSHALGALLRPGNADAASRRYLVPALPLEAARSKLGFLFRLGSKVTGRKPRCLRAATCPARAALTNIVMKCVFAGVAKKTSLFPFRVCLYPRVVHLVFLARSSQCPPNALSRVWWSQRSVAGL